MARFTIPSVLIETTRQLNIILGINLGVPFSGKLPEDRTEEIRAEIELYFPICSDGSFHRVKLDSTIRTGYSDEVNSNLLRFVTVEQLDFRGQLLSDSAPGLDLIHRLRKINAISWLDAPKRNYSFSLDAEQIERLMRTKTH
jgi:hypothetical protein